MNINNNLVLNMKSFLSPQNNGGGNQFFSPNNGSKFKNHFSPKYNKFF